ncbi:MAG: hypothetical protein PHI97_30575 [Desulfobulbus sp.]|nr:hypothetical protein [Desulfobulbus sp.]
MATRENDHDTTSESARQALDQYCLSKGEPMDPSKPPSSIC